MSGKEGLKNGSEGIDTDEVFQDRDDAPSRHEYHDATHGLNADVEMLNEELANKVRNEPFEDAIKNVEDAVGGVAQKEVGHTCRRNENSHSDVGHGKLEERPQAIEHGAAQRDSDGFAEIDGR